MEAERSRVSVLLIADHLGHVWPLDGEDGRTRGALEVALVLGATDAPVDVEASLAHPATLQHDDGVRHAHGVEHAGEAAAVAVPAVKACDRRAVQVGEDRPQQRVEHAVGEGAPLRVAEDCGGAFGRAREHEEDGEGAVDLAPLVGFGARGRDRASVAADDQRAPTSVRGPGAQPRKHNFSVMPIESIAHIVPISSIGDFPSAVNPTMLKVVKRFFKRREAASKDVLKKLKALPREELDRRATALGIASEEFSNKKKLTDAITDALAAQQPPTESELSRGPLFAYNSDAYM
eukprot:7389643-Prymnesium_polylepis.1